MINFLRAKSMTKLKFICITKIDHFLKQSCILAFKNVKIIFDRNCFKFKKLKYRNYCI